MNYKGVVDLATASTKKVTTATAKRKNAKKQEKKPPITCCLCGRTLDESSYYKSKGSLIWTGLDGRVPVCKDCLETKYNLVKERYGERIASMIMCHWCDLPWVESIYESIIQKNSAYEFFMYYRTLNGPQWARKSYLTSMLEGDLGSESVGKKDDDREEKWSREDLRNKREVIEMLGYDPFDGYGDADRKALFGDLISFIDEDLLDDPFKLSMVIQLVINNNQIRSIDLQIAKLDPAKDADEIKTLNTIKKDTVQSVNSIAKENEISVKNRSDKSAGRNTLTYMMKDLRNKDFREAEANYYNMLRSEGTQWAANMSMEAIMQNALFDENDRQEIFINQRQMIEKLQHDLDDKTEELRLLKIRLKEIQNAE